MNSVCSHVHNLVDVSGAELSIQVHYNGMTANGSHDYDYYETGIPFRNKIPPIRMRSTTQPIARLLKLSVYAQEIRQDSTRDKTLLEQQQEFVKYRHCICYRSHLSNSVLKTSFHVSGAERGCASSTREDTR